MILVNDLLVVELCTISQITCRRWTTSNIFFLDVAYAALRELVESDGALVGWLRSSTAAMVSSLQRLALVLPSLLMALSVLPLVEASFLESSRTMTIRQFWGRHRGLSIANRGMPKDDDDDEAPVSSPDDDDDDDTTSTTKDTASTTKIDTKDPYSIPALSTSDSTTESDPKPAPTTASSGNETATTDDETDEDGSDDDGTTTSFSQWNVTNSTKQKLFPDKNETIHIPKEKEQPSSWPSAILSLFLVMSIVLCVVAGFRANQKRRDRQGYEEIQSLVV